MGSGNANGAVCKTQQLYPVGRERASLRTHVGRNGALHGAAPPVPSPIRWARVRVTATSPALLFSFTHTAQENRYEWNFQ